MNGEFPFPQTLGRQRDLNTVAADPNAGKLVRPIQYEAQSLLSQVGSYVNNWLGDVSLSNEIKDSQSLNKAGKVSGAPAASFSTLVDTRSGGPLPIQTIANEFLEEIGLKVSSVEPGSEVPGRPVSPTTINFQYSNKIDKSIKKVVSKGGDWVTEQVKGLFNVAYESPVEAEAVPAPNLGAIGKHDDTSMVLIVIAILYLVTT